LPFPNPHEPAPPFAAGGESPPRSSPGRFYIHHIKGSHHFLKHPDKPGLRVTVPLHNADLKRKTLTTIIDQAGYSVEEFLEIL
jgi:predicted RNA binding protein YcfA (HicA-like mRNA interferase family)